MTTRPLNHYPTPLFYRHNYSLFIVSRISGVPEIVIISGVPKIIIISGVPENLNEIN